MKIKLDGEFTNFKGEKIKDGNQIYADQLIKQLQAAGVEIKEDIAKLFTDFKPVTLKEVLTTTLTEITGVQKEMSGKDKFECYQLAQKLAKGKEVDLKSEEITKIKEYIGKVYQNISIVGQAWDQLEGSK